MGETTTGDTTIGRSSYSIGIAGCGPAGLAAALALSRIGHKVTLFDQWQEPKPLGSGLILQPTGLAVLDWLRLGARMRRLGARIERLYGRVCPSQRIVLDVRYDALSDQQPGLAVHRAALFNVLLDAVREAGLALEAGKCICSMDRTSLVFQNGRRSASFDLVIDALGTKSPLLAAASAPATRRRLDYGALWASLPWPGKSFDINALEQRYQRASVMIGVLPIGRTFETGPSLAAFFWSLKTDERALWRQAGLDPWKRQVLSLWPETEPLLNHIQEPDQMTLAAYGHHTLPLPFGPGIAFIGDSAHSTSPQLGQGANMALLDVASLTAALQCHDNLEDALPAYARLRRTHVRLYQALSAVFTPFYQSDSAILPLLRDRLVAPATRLPGVPRLLANIVAGRLGAPYLPASSA